AGMPPDAARDAARARFGDPARARRACLEISRRRARGARRSELLAGLRQDLREATRRLIREPGFTVIVVLTLGLGIGANLIVFGLVDALLLRPVPGIADPDQLFRVTSGSVSYPAYQDFRDNSPQLEGLAGFQQRTLALGWGSETGIATAGVVTGNFFPLLGAIPSAGRLLSPADDAPGASPAVVLSQGYWRRELGGDPSVVGKVLQLNGVPFTVAGITARGFRGPELDQPPDIWIPVGAWPRVAPSGFARLTMETRNWSWITMYGRLRPGVSLAAAQRALNLEAARIERTWPDQTPTGFSLELAPARVAAIPADARVGVVSFLGIILGVVGIVLLLAVANVANLMLARTTRRGGEIGIRLALGAGRWRLVRQFLTDSLLLSLLAGGAAIGIMTIVFQALSGFTFPGGARLDDLVTGPDLRLVLVALGLTVGLALLLGIIPAVYAAHPGALSRLRETRQVGSGRPQSRLQRALVAVQVALSVVLLIGAGLFGRSLRQGLQLDPGFDPANLVTASADVGLARYETDQARQYYATVLDRIGSRPGIVAAAWTEAIPLTGDVSSETVGIQGYEPAPGEDTPEIEVNRVSRDYFRTLGIPLAAGAGFEGPDPLGPRNSIVVNQAFVRRYWPDGQALGRRVILGDTCIVAGVARDSRYHTLTEAPVPLAYLPLAQRPLRSGGARMTLFVRSRMSPPALNAEIRRELQAAGPQVPVFGQADFGARIAELLLPQRVGASLLGLFGALALLLAGIGIYGVVNYMVATRVREIAIRLSLGESPGGVVRRMIRSSMVPIIGGLVAGILLAALASRALAGFLYGVSPLDPETYVVMAVILLLTTVIAALLPALRGTAVSPMRALRSE
ncbi:MAG: ABC transporter permease, partial [Gemmatimonadales bacterium]